MNLIRSILHMIWMVLTVIPWATAVVLMRPFVSRQRLYRFCVGWLNQAVHAGRWLLGIRWRVSGLENLPQDPKAPAVLLVKHQSAWETFALPGFMPRPLAYVFKRELLRIPFFGWAIGSLDMIHIDRGRRAEAFNLVVQQGRRLLEQGSWVIMFPEGTRVPRGHKGKYTSGGVRLALECGAPIVPIAVTSARCWPPRAFVKRPGVIEVSVGPLIPSEGRSASQLLAEVEGWIEAEMRRLDPEAYPADAPTPVYRPPSGPKAEA